MKRIPGERNAAVEPVGQSGLLHRLQPVPMLSPLSSEWLVLSDNTWPSSSGRFPHCPTGQQWRIIVCVMNQPQKLSSGAAILFGLVFVAAGILPMLAAFDIGPLGQDDINGPPWLGFVAGGIFTSAGLAVIAGPRSPLLNSLFATLALAGLAAIGSWIAFGVGERACSGSISLPWLWSESGLSGLACRIPFGLGAMITDAFLCYAILSTLQKALGGPPRLARLLKAAEWLILASLAPFLLLLVIILIVRGGLGAMKTRWATGAWPRNEEFIARQKAKGLLQRFGQKPPPLSAVHDSKEDLRSKTHL